jgi:hypothetical protein
VCDSPDFLGGTWNADGVIVFGRADGPLMQVSASSGEPVSVTQLDESRGEFAHGWPVFLPDGRRFLYLAAGMELRNRAIYAGSLDSPARTEVLRANARPLSRRQATWCFIATPRYWRNPLTWNGSR